jgi:nitroreductase
MDALETIVNRHSVRDFKSDPISKEIVIKIMEAATRAPSGGNGQPWEVFIAAGATIERIRKEYKERAAASPGGARPGGPPPLPAFIQERMATIRIERMKLLGLDPADPAAGKAYMQISGEWAARLSGVPVLAVICMHKALSSHLDIGMFIQSICIASKSYGIDTFIASSFVSQPDILRKELGIPDDFNIITGIGLGYPNDNIINTYRSPRRPISDVVRYRD